MVKLYCDRCGKEIEGFNERNYRPIEEAANGEDTFFYIEIHSKPLGYNYHTPDLCVDCMRKINEAVKTVWDGTPNWEKEAES